MQGYNWTAHEHDRKDKWVKHVPKQHKRGQYWLADKYHLCNHADQVEYVPTK